MQIIVLQMIYSLILLVSNEWGPVCENTLQDWTFSAIIYCLFIQSAASAHALSIHQDAGRHVVGF